ncbi:MAG: hypothetical protein ACRD10_08960, partial [Terriglobia bacterium]
IAQLLASAPVVRDACDLDLLMFLYRHPRTMLTSEHLAGFVGYETSQIAKSLDGFIEAGLLERTQNPAHAARMYLLVLDGPQDDGLRRLLTLASTGQGRSGILRSLGTPPVRNGPGAVKQGPRPPAKIARIA